MKARKGPAVLAHLASLANAHGIIDGSIGHDVLAHHLNLTRGALRTMLQGLTARGCLEHVSRGSDGLIGTYRVTGTPYATLSFATGHAVHHRASSKVAPADPDDDDTDDEMVLEAFTSPLLRELGITVLTRLATDPYKGTRKYRLSLPRLRFMEARA